MTKEKIFSWEEISRHNKIDDCWIVINQKVIKITDFIDAHPGGVSVLMPYLGKDATKAFSQVHNEDTLNILNEELILGSVDPNEIQKEEKKLTADSKSNEGNLLNENKKESKIGENGKVDEIQLFAKNNKIFVVEENKVKIFDELTKEILGEIIAVNKPRICFGEKVFAVVDSKGVTLYDYAQHFQKSDQKMINSLESIINTADFEKCAKIKMKKEQLDYYQTGAEDEITLRENKNAFQRIWLKPRVLINVSSVNISCNIFGCESSFPMYLSATAMGKYADPENGEASMIKAAANCGIIYMIPTMGSLSFNEIVKNRTEKQQLWAQLYINPQRKTSERFIKKVLSKGIRTFVLTVDAPRLGKRERDMRNKFVAIDDEYSSKKKTGKNSGTSTYLTQFIDPSITWEIIEWIKSFSSGVRVIVKGIQSPEDAIEALEYGVDGIIISNHGGRQLDTCRSAIEILPEIVKALKSVGAREHIKVFVDGGIRRGRDIFKALALGADAVGIGKPYLYALAAHGQDGLEKLISILQDEFKRCMELCGCKSIKDISSTHVDTQNLHLRSFY